MDRRGWKALEVLHAGVGLPDRRELVDAALQEAEQRPVENAVEVIHAPAFDAQREVLVGPVPVLGAAAELAKEHVDGRVRALGTGGFVEYLRRASVV